MTQLVEWSLPTPEFSGSNPAIGKFYVVLTVSKFCVERTRIKKKEAGNGPFKKGKSNRPKWREVNNER